MPIFVREWIVASVLVLITTHFFDFFLEEKRAKGWGLLVFLVLTAAYFSRSFPVFILFFFLIVYLFVPKKNLIDRTASGFLLFPLLPLWIKYLIPFPGVQQLITLNYARLVIIFILLPVFIKYFFQGRFQKRLFAYKSDKYVVLFLLYSFLIAFRDLTFTNAFRAGLYLFIDYFIPYFTLSRAISSREDFILISKHMLFTAIFFAFAAITETFKGWLLFSSALGQDGNIFYTSRWGLIRAAASFQPIPLGVYFCIMSALLLCIRNSVHRLIARRLNFIFVLFFWAILCAISRGPLVGYFVLFGVYCVLRGTKIIKIIPVLIVLIAFVSITPFGRKIVASLPFVGYAEQGSIDYRVKLWINSLSVIKKYPLFGSSTYHMEPEMQEMIQGQGIIDIVNSYLGIALRSGMIGLLLFMMIFLSLLYRIYIHYSRAPDEEVRVLGKILFSILISFMVMIFTVSMVSYISYYMWILIALSASYINLARNELQLEKQ